MEAVQSLSPPWLSKQSSIDQFNPVQFIFLNVYLFFSIEIDFIITTCLLSFDSS